MQMDEVRFLKFRQVGDVVAGIGYIDAEEPFALEAAVHPDDKTFPEELSQLSPSVTQGNGRDAVSLLVAYQHLGFYAVILKRFHQPASGNGGPSSPFGGVDNQYSHDVCCIDSLICCE